MAHQPSILTPRTSKRCLEKECRTRMKWFFTVYNIQHPGSQKFIDFSMLELSIRTIFSHLFEYTHAFDIPDTLCQWIRSLNACIVWKKPFFFVCSYNIITLLHHSPYHSLFYWAISYPSFSHGTLLVYFILHQKGAVLYPWPASLASSKPFLNVSHSFGCGSTRTIHSFQDIGAPKWHSHGFSFALHSASNSWCSV